MSLPCRHKYVKLAFHGFRKMARAEKQAMYAQGTQRHSFDTDDFTTIDTLFSLAEAYLFMQVLLLYYVHAIALLLTAV